MGQISRSFQSWLNVAHKMALSHNSGGRVNIIALAIRANRIIGIGSSKYPVLKGGIGEYYLLGTHAEYDLLANFDVAKSNIFVVGVTVNGNLICTKPCARCNNLLVNSRAKRIIYYDQDKQPVIKARCDLVTSNVRSIL